MPGWTYYLKAEHLSFLQQWIQWSAIPDQTSFSDKLILAEIVYSKRYCEPTRILTYLHQNTWDTYLVSIANCYNYSKQFDSLFLFIFMSNILRSDITQHSYDWWRMWRCWAQTKEPEKHQIDGITPLGRTTKTLECVAWMAFHGSHLHTCLYIHLYLRVWEASSTASKGD